MASKKRKSTHYVVVSEQVVKVLDKYSTLNSFLEDAESHPNLKKFMKQLNEIDFQVMKLSERVSSPDGGVLCVPAKPSETLTILLSATRHFFCKEGIITTDPLLLLASFTQEIIACILGFWYTDKIVQEKRS
ncbi:hypothetical protein C0030_002980 [Candidatus Liberibacter solanacearum]|uniref:Uncharacterized protein n=1 Tax=Candidatus Liberibacter solanacearum TaxID=556287 RepID=A0A424FMA3_9HYPH|nr:hypothetical protein [Candidatus Liberibacter solanacearum]RPD37289.1 hypothetical protein C0030_002980 [Candidatus Liberibacter solanacearum]